jgi:hypothetical protein
MIRRFFSPPVFEKEEDNFRAKFVNGFAWMAIVLLTLAMIPYLFRVSHRFHCADTIGTDPCDDRRPVPPAPGKY